MWVGSLSFALTLSATRPGMCDLSNLIHLHLIPTFNATALSRSRSETGFRRQQYSSDGKSDADEQRLWINTTSASSDSCGITLIRSNYHGGREREPSRVLVVYGAPSQGCKMQSMCAILKSECPQNPPQSSDGSSIHIV